MHLILLYAVMGEKNNYQLERLADSAERIASASESVGNLANTLNILAKIFIFVFILVPATILFIGLFGA